MSRKLTHVTKGQGIFLAQAKINIPIKEKSQY
jgi:hypothetical protein